MNHHAHPFLWKEKEKNGEKHHQDQRKTSPIADCGETVGNEKKIDPARLEHQQGKRNRLAIANGPVDGLGDGHDDRRLHEKKNERSNHDVVVWRHDAEMEVGGVKRSAHRSSDRLDARIETGERPKTAWSRLDGV